MSSYTSNKRKDGFGARYQNLIWDIIYCELKDLKYFYTPFHRFAHNYGGEPWDKDWVKKLEDFINVKDNYPKETEEKNSKKLTTGEVYPFIESNIKKLRESKELKKIKFLFFENKEKIFTRGFNIAVHIRRPNSQDCRIQGANTPDEYYITLINKLRQLYKDKNPLFHIYSQGNVKKFKVYESKDTILHIDEEITKTFFSLASADVLCTSASSFSYTAAMISNGTIFYHKFWHRPLPDWIVVNYY